MPNAILKFLDPHMYCFSFAASVAKGLKYQPRCSCADFRLFAVCVCAHVPFNFVILFVYNLDNMSCHFRIKLHLEVWCTMGEGASLAWRFTIMAAASALTQ